LREIIQIIYNLTLEIKRVNFARANFNNIRGAASIRIFKKKWMVVGGARAARVTFGFWLLKARGERSRKLAEDANFA
jgi:hypothetical protein